MGKSEDRSILDDVEFELLLAEAKFPPFNSSHEGYAVILEELDELWEEIKNNKSSNLIRQREEAIQVAAMACRFVKFIDAQIDFLKQRKKG